MPNFEKTLTEIVAKLVSWGFSMGFGWNMKKLDNHTIAIYYNKEMFLYESLRRCWLAAQEIYMAKNKEKEVVKVSIQNKVDKFGVWAFHLIFEEKQNTTETIKKDISEIDI